MAKNSILTDGEIASGLVLTCQAHPTSDNMWIMMMFKNKYPLFKIPNSTLKLGFGIFFDKI
jgi:hypothetical protein